MANVLFPFFMRWRPRYVSFGGSFCHGGSHVRRGGSVSHGGRTESPVTFPPKTRYPLNPQSPTYENHTHHQHDLLPLRNALCPISTGKGLSNRNERVPQKEKFIRRNLPPWRFNGCRLPLQVPREMLGNRTFGAQR